MNVILTKINNMRNNRGITPQAFVKLSNLNKNILYNSKQRDSMPTIPIIEKLCIGYGITLEQFFCGFNTSGLTKDEVYILQDWISLSENEKSIVNYLIDVLKGRDE